MKNFAFISRHAPTAEQHALANAEGIKLTHVGDFDAFSINPSIICEMGEKYNCNFKGVIIVHPAAAMRLACAFLIGVFKNGTRAGPDDKPQFFAESFHVFDIRD